jgi:TRAP-type transport system small permease protein
MATWFRKLEKCITGAGNILNYVAVAALALMMLLGTCDVLGRYLFSKPIVGTYEMTSVLMSVLTLLPMAYILLKENHIDMTLFTDRLSPRAQSKIGFATSILLFFFFSIATWQGIVTLLKYYRDGRLIPNIDLPSYLVMPVAILGTLIMSLMLIVHAVRCFNRVRGSIPPKE